MTEYMVKMKVGGKWVEGHRPCKKAEVFKAQNKAVDEMFCIHKTWVKYVKQIVADMGDNDSLEDFHRLAEVVPTTFGIAEREISEWNL